MLQGREEGRLLGPIDRRTVLTALVAGLPLARARAKSQGWDDVVTAGRGGFVSLQAGTARSTDHFIKWAARRMQALYGSDVVHVRSNDAAGVLARIEAARVSGRVEAGAVDLIWLDGPTLLEDLKPGLFYGPVLQRLPNAALIEPSMTLLSDGAVHQRGFVVPWRITRPIFIRDDARLKTPPRSMTEILYWSLGRPGWLTHPAASDVTGAAFLAQALIEFSTDPSNLSSPATDASFASTTAPFWTWYRSLRPSLWRGGKSFPEDGTA